MAEELKMDDFVVPLPSAASAPRAIVAERARECHPSHGPRVLHVEGGDLRVIGLLPVRQAERVRIRHAEVEPILHE